MKKNITALILPLLMLCYCSTQLSASPKLAKQPIVSEIKIEGLWRTNPKVVLRELLFTENDVLTTTALLASVQRLKNLQIFSKVIPLLDLKPNNKVSLTLTLQEKWTTIPYANLSGGGGTTYAYAGIYDINTLGRLIETGIQYDNWNGHHGGVVWMRDPRFLNQRLLFGFDLWKTKKARQLYSHDATPQGSIVLNTKKILFILKKEITPYFQIGGKFEVRNEAIIDNDIASNISNTTDLQSLETGSQTDLFNTLFIELGTLHHENYLVDGQLSSLEIKHSNRALASGHTATQVDWSNRLFWRLPYHANLGFRIKLGWTNTPKIQDYYYIGGFQNVRGYLDGQFRNKTYWQINVEYRIPSYRSPWLVLQHVFFIDAIGMGDQLKDLTNSEQRYSSAGLGLRIISPRIYSFNGRIDFTPFTSGKSPSAISFGAQQFF